MKPRALLLLTCAVVLLAQTRIDYQKQLANFPSIVKVERAVCSGSGNSLDAQGNKIPYMDTSVTPPVQKKDAQGNLLWAQYDCAGIQYFKFTLADNSTRTYIGINTSTVPTTNNFVTWTDVPITPSNPQ